ncbi:hypothetical protein [Leptospira weilii]|uniref:hypothetical protein n=1 Tax=Leptospira weilii TaxID=28184 RepID=UPI001EF3A126|nr:hypothetical protein [Leptospira weilii]ULH30483.1 hypothetical protein FH586_06325 [Leptospira weilii]
MVLREKQSVGFISLSDNYRLPDRPDWFAMPNPIQKKRNAEYLILGSKYRDRLLSNIKISETDKVFIYDYSTDYLVSFTVKNLNAVACLNVHASSKDWPYRQGDYQIGFAIDKKLLKGFRDKYFSNILVYIGKQNPFNKGKMKRILWKKIDLKEFPNIKMKPEHVSIFKGYTFGQTYQFESEGLKYHVQDILKSNEVKCRRLLVIKSKTKDLVFENLYSKEREGASFVDLGFVGTGNHQWGQWTGKMFKNRPPVIFGFLYESFTCEDIDFLKLPASRIRVSCDSRL